MHVVETDVVGQDVQLVFLHNLRHGFRDDDFLFRAQKHRFWVRSCAVVAKSPHVVFYHSIGGSAIVNGRSDMPWSLLLFAENFREFLLPTEGLVASNGWIIDERVATFDVAVERVQLAVGLGGAEPQ